jgi:ATP-dependent helicase/nuclease subunit A
VAEDAERALRLGDFLDTRPDSPDAAWRTLRDTFLTQKGTPLARKVSGALSKRLGADAGRFIALHQELSDRLTRALARLASQRALRLNRAVLVAGNGLLAQYQALKLARDALDFTDAEWLALDLLTDAEHADALLAKLDARWKHILLDEFQDANPLQWRIITAWLSAYGADPERPDLFVVGDPKQSIYRFRRAEPRLFEAAADFLATHFDAVSHRQNHTRRCAPRVVAWVNGVFGAVQAETGGSGYAGFVEHSAFQTGLPGHGEVIVAPRPGVDDETEAPAGLRDPLATPAPSRPNRRAGEAALVAARIRELVGRLRIAGDGGRAARYSDIYVLSASRTDIATFEDAFKAAGVPYVSSRRGGLLDTLEVADVLALLAALVSPGDDLKLAHALKSPIFGFADDDLKYLARLTGGTWDARLSAWAESEAAPARVPRARRLLARWREAAGRLPPHDLLDSIYHSGDIEARYAAALPETLRAGALANLRGLLALSLDFASGRYPSLPRFLDELRAMARRGGDETPDEAPVAQGDVVHMFTIHGAKGLEAPIVFLIKADETGRDIAAQGVLVDWPPDRDRPDHFSVYGSQAWRGAERDDLFQQERLLAERERLNLLYVAMTRARQALFVSGLETDDPHSWMARLLAALPAIDGTPAMTWCDDVEAHVEPGEVLATEADVHVVPIGGRLPAMSPEAEFGTLVHRYLELVTVGQTSADIRQLLDIDARAFEAIEGAALACLASDWARRFFDARQYVQARNEVEYMGPDGQRRRIDRLVECEDGIWVLDYKTGSLSEPDLSRRAQPYLEQLHEYTWAVQALYPGRPVRAALLFSDGGYWELPIP